MNNTEDNQAPQVSLEAQMAASHDLWSAKATSRLVSYINLTSALGRLFREDVISAEAMNQLYLVLDRNEREEREATFEAEMRYKEVTK